MTADGASCSDNGQAAPDVPRQAADGPDQGERTPRDAADPPSHLAIALATSGATRRPRLVFATHNAHKVREVTAILGEAMVLEPGVIVGADAVGAGEVTETGVTFAENALLKARTLVRSTGMAAFADDSGLCVDVLGGAPGVFSARWAGGHGDDAANLALLLDQLRDVPAGRRGAWFECVAALVTPSGEEWVETGRLPGTLTTAPCGEAGFGYDPIFLPSGGARTCAQSPPAE
ncbi:MAG: non-canonical purine NTP pyrophosphatase, partial [Bifidobacteriaceae bacterium]|nr:non-canonical purine NTP pyrophosphatase [Bifidobacteriaceae bacterium]